MLWGRVHVRQSPNSHIRYALCNMIIILLLQPCITQVVFFFRNVLPDTLDLYNREFICLLSEQHDTVGVRLHAIETGSLRGHVWIKIQKVFQSLLSIKLSVFSSSIRKCIKFWHFPNYVKSRVAQTFGLTDLGTWRLLCDSQIVLTHYFVAPLLHSA